MQRTCIRYLNHLSYSFNDACIASFLFIPCISHTLWSACYALKLTYDTYYIENDHCLHSLKLKTELLSQIKSVGSLIWVNSNFFQTGVMVLCLLQYIQKRFKDCIMEFFVGCAVLRIQDIWFGARSLSSRALKLQHSYSYPQ